MTRFFLIMACFLCFSAQAQKDTLKVISYNIWNGFDFRKDLERQSKTIDWLKSKAPDVVALQELCGYNEKTLLEDAKKWGHNYAVLLKESCHSVGLTSSKPIHLKEKVREYLWHGLLHCETFGIDFFVVHLSPKDYEFRMKETAIIRSLVSESSSESYMVLGDFNAQSPFDGDRDLNFPMALENKRQSDKENLKYNTLADGEFDYSVMSQFLSIPLIDIVQRYVAPINRYTVPAKARIGPGRSDMELERDKRRIDFIMVSRKLALQCVNADVFNGEDTDTLSDHYPIMGEFIIDKESE
jgi:endonuclease/exonuclease/phosphatase family metal-dependent hydrolase